MIKNIVFLFCFSILVLHSYGQESTIIVHKDPRIDILNAKREAAKPVVKRVEGPRNVKGYRVQVINTRSRDDAFKVKADLLRKYTSQKTYLIFQSPYFKVRIGNFISREEANKFKAALSLQYPTGTYVIDDVVEYTPPPEISVPAK